jgi:hypothetical protein
MIYLVLWRDKQGIKIPVCDSHVCHSECSENILNLLPGCLLEWTCWMYMDIPQISLKLMTLSQSRKCWYPTNYRLVNFINHHCTISWMKSFICSWHISTVRWSSSSSSYVNIHCVILWVQMLAYCQSCWFQIALPHFWYSTVMVIVTLLKPTGCMLCPCCIYVFCIYLRTNSDLCHLLIGFYNRNERCLLRSTDWVFK